MSTDASTRLSSPETITGEQLREYVGFAAGLLRANVEVINSLNVFPVPDGDTGTNMFLTLDAVVKALDGSGERTAGEAAAVMSRAAMMEARGNSGIILSQFFKGLAVGLEGSETLGTAEMANALAEARAASYKAVADPVEGTMLTVIDWMARAAAESETAGRSMSEMLAHIGCEAESAVSNTPTMLAVLREAGVVDAGGHGLSVMFEGVRRAHAGEASPESAGVLDVPEAIGVDHSAARAGVVSESFLAHAEHEEFGYCVQFVVEGEGLDVDAIRDQIMEVSQSTVVVGGSETIRVHGHAEDPGPMISAAVVHGQLGRVSMQNMDEQHVEFAESHRDAAPSAGSADTQKVSLVSVAWGSGIEEVFRHYGASGLLQGGDTMNPSVSQVLEALNAAPSDSVVFLPNNKNIIPAAQQAAELSPKTVEVVPTRTIPQGVAALLAYDSESDADENAERMTEALQGVSSGEITTSQRTVSLNGVEASEGQTIGMLDGRLVAAGDGVAPVLADLLRSTDFEAELVTLYWGGDLDEEAAEAVSEAVEPGFPEAEFELVHGGQPHYHFLVSIE